MLLTLAKRGSSVGHSRVQSRFLKLFSDAPAPTAVRRVGKVDVVTPTVDLFPWICKPSPLFRNPLHHLFNKLKISMSVAAFDILERCKVDNVGPSSQDAMHCAAMGIFRHKLMKDHYIGVSSKYSGASEMIVQEMQDETCDIDMSQIFDKKLEDFFLYAIQKHCLNTTQLCTYSLQNVTDARVVDLSAYINARRDGVTPPHDIQVSNWGATFFVNSEKFLESGVPFVSSLLDDLKSQLMNYTDSTVRIKVDVDCIGKACNLTSPS